VVERSLQVRAAPGQVEVAHGVVSGGQERLLLAAGEEAEGGLEVGLGLVEVALAHRQPTQEQ